MADTILFKQQIVDNTISSTSIPMVLQKLSNETLLKNKCSKNYNLKTFRFMTAIQNISGEKSDNFSLVKCC